MCNIFITVYRLFFLQKNKVVIFMKGVPEEPRCGFSNAVVQILRMHGVTYDAHDVLKNEDLRQGKLLKIFIIIISNLCIELLHSYMIIF